MPWLRRRPRAWSAGPRLAPVGAERPVVALGVGHGEVPGAVVGVVQLAQHRGPGRGGPREQPVRIVGGHVRAERAGPQRPGVFGAVLPGRPEHDPASGRPGQLGVIHAVALAVYDGLLEAERVDDEADQPAGVARPQRRPDLRWWCLIVHAPSLAPRRPARLGRFGTLLALGGTTPLHPPPPAPALAPRPPPPPGPPPRRAADSASGRGQRTAPASPAPPGAVR